MSTSAQKTARLKNLEKAREARELNLRKKALEKVDHEITHIKQRVDNKLDDKIDKAVDLYLDKVDRGKLKDAFLQVFYDIGGRKTLKKWAKENQKEFYKLMANILKAESEANREPTKGVVVQIFGADDKQPKSIVEVTPNKVTDAGSSS